MRTDYSTDLGINCAVPSHCVTHVSERPVISEVSIERNRLALFGLDNVDFDDVVF